MSEVSRANETRRNEARRRQARGAREGAVAPPASGEQEVKTPGAARAGSFARTLGSRGRAKAPAAAAGGAGEPAARQLMALLAELGRRPVPPGMPGAASTKGARKTKTAAMAGGDAAAAAASEKAEVDAGRPTTAAPPLHPRRRDERSDAADPTRDAAVAAPPPAGAASPLASVAAALPDASGPRLDPAALQALVEYATIVRDTGGTVELRLGLDRETLGGLRLRLRALGDRRIALQLRGGAAAGAAGASEVARLVELLRAEGLDIVAVAARPA